MGINCRCGVPGSMNRCNCCSLSNQFGEGELDMSGQVTTTTTTVITTPASHMSPTIKKVTNPSASEIDDIFTRKAGTATPKANPHNPSSDFKQKKRKKKTAKTQPAEPKRPAPEIIFDPSTHQAHTSTSENTSQDRPVPPRKKRKVVDAKSDQDKFRDSRGTGRRKHHPRQCH
jgi:hypothetical protein